MQGPVYKEDHQVAQFQIYPEPKGYSNMGERKITTKLQKSETIGTAIDEVENKKYLLFSVIVFATNYFKDKPLAGIQVNSSYLVEYNISGQLPVDMACGLVERSIHYCYNIYIDKVKGTYLKDNTLTLHKNIKEDCIKQKLDKIMKN